MNKRLILATLSEDTKLIMNKQIYRYINNKEIKKESVHKNTLFFSLNNKLFATVKCENLKLLLPIDLKNKQLLTKEINRYKDYWIVISGSCKDCAGIVCARFKHLKYNKFSFD